MALDALPMTWREAADAGVIRLRVNSNIVTVFPPYPFLECYLRSLGTCRLSFTDSLELVCAARVMPHLSGALGRGKKFELTAALELSLPESPLMRHILGCPELKPLGLLPLSRTAPPLRKLASPSLGPVRNEVLLVSDGDAVTKPGDIAVPVLVPSASRLDVEPAWLVIQVKTPLSNVSVRPDYVRGGLSAFVERLEASSAADVRLGCFLTTLDPHARGGKTVGAISKLQHFNATSSAQRHIGLAVVRDEVLRSCSLPLYRILHSAVGADRDFAQWVRAICSSKATRQRMAAFLRQQADAMGNDEELDDDGDVPALRAAASALEVAGAG